MFQKHPQFYEIRCIAYVTLNSNLQELNCYISWQTIHFLSSIHAVWLSKSELTITNLSSKSWLIFIGSGVSIVILSLLSAAFLYEALDYLFYSVWLHSLPSSAEDKNAWSYNSTPPNASPSVMLRYQPRQLLVCLCTFCEYIHSKLWLLPFILYIA
jgi:hypothetical protein